VSNTVVKLQSLSKMKANCLIWIMHIMIYIYIYGTCYYEVEVFHFFPKKS
jgi:hypothetical protein